MLSVRVVTWSLVAFFALSFVACVVYGLLVPESLHMSDFLEHILPGFQWLTPRGFLAGLLWACVYGVWVGLVFTPIYNALHRRSVAS